MACTGSIPIFFFFILFSSSKSLLCLVTHHHWPTFILKDEIFKNFEKKTTKLEKKTKNRRQERPLAQGYIYLESSRDGWFTVHNNEGLFPMAPTVHTREKQIETWAFYFLWKFTAIDKTISSLAARNYVSSCCVLTTERRHWMATERENGTSTALTTHHTAWFSQQLRAVKDKTLRHQARSPQRHLAARIQLHKQFHREAHISSQKCHKSKFFFHKFKR